MVSALRVVLPLLGAAAALAILEGEGDLGPFSPAAAIAIPVAVLGLPAVVSAWLARRDGVGDAILWLLVTLAAELALVFGVGLVGLGLGPG
jgi:hypothetical protein